MTFKARKALCHSRVPFFIVEKFVVMVYNKLFNFYRFVYVIIQTKSMEGFCNLRLLDCDCGLVAQFCIACYHFSIFYERGNSDVFS